MYLCSVVHEKGLHVGRTYQLWKGEQGRGACNTLYVEVYNSIADILYFYQESFLMGCLCHSGSVQVDVFFCKKGAWSS